MVAGHAFPHGLLPVVQTPFLDDGGVDHAGLERLVDLAVTSGADGLLTPAVASEVASLSPLERRDVVSTVAHAAAGRVPVVVGASADQVEGCRVAAAAATQIGGGYLVAVPQRLYGDTEAIVAFFAAVAAGNAAPLLVQDLRWNAPGLPVDVVARLVDAVPTIAGVKVESVPAGPAYTELLTHFDDGLFVCGGWAVTQLIEALDRGIHAIVPECAMLPLYRTVLDMYAAGRRNSALELFRRALPVLAYTNQELFTSIAFFKRLLVRKGVIDSARLRAPGFTWDAYNVRVADELIALVLDLEQEVTAPILEAPPASGLPE